MPSVSCMPGEHYNNYIRGLSAGHGWATDVCISLCLQEFLQRITVLPMERRVIGAAGVSGILFGIAVAFNATAVATEYWVCVTTSGATSDLGVIGGTSNIGLWRYCPSQNFKFSNISGLKQTSACLDIGDPSNIAGYSDESAFIHASRALSIAAAGLCLFSFPLAIIGYVKRKGLVVTIAALIAFLQAGSLAAALLLFFLKFFVQSHNPTNDSSIEVEVEVEVLPGWSFYIGGVGVILYGIGGLIFVFTGIVMHRGSTHVAPTQMHRNEEQYMILREMPPEIM